MNELIIELNLSSAETVNNVVIEKLYKLALTSNVEDLNSLFNMSLKGYINATAAYEDSVLYLRAKFPQLTINVLDNNFYIRFVDEEVSRVLIENISSDGVGVSKTDAQRMTALPNRLFENNTTILTFDELDKFGNITIGDRCFNKCTNLTSLDLSTVSKLTGFSSFGDCTNLTIKLNMPNLVSLGNFSFAHSGITEIEDLGNITNIPGYNGACFSACTNLTKVTLPVSCTELGDGCFRGCRNLTTISPTTYLTTLKIRCLRCRGIVTSIMNFSNVTNLYSICGESGYLNGDNRSIFRLVYLPKVVNPNTTDGLINLSNKYYHDGLFHDLGTNILYLRDILHFYGASFCNAQITALVINNVTPPTVHYYKNYTLLEFLDWLAKYPNRAGAPTDLFVESSITTIYVPDSAVTTYKTDPIWSTWANKIESMNNLTKVATEEDLQPDLIALIEAYM